MREIVDAARTVRSAWPASRTEHLNLYLANGRFGGCFDAWGLMNKGVHPEEAESLSNTDLSHADHWDRGEWGLDSWLMLGRISWAEGCPPPPAGYRQEHDLWNGRVETALEWPGRRARLRATFHPEIRDLLGIEISYDGRPGGMPPVAILPEANPKTGHYGQTVPGSVEPAGAGGAEGLWAARVRAGSADSVLALRVVSAEGRVVLDPRGAGLAVRFPDGRGRHLLVIGAAGWNRREALLEQMRRVASAEAFLAEAAEGWNRRWGTTFLDIPVPELQKLWARSVYYLLCTYAAEVRSPAPPMGWTNNAWPRHFPQDTSCSISALLRLGRTEEPRCWIEFYRGYLDNMKSFTRDVFKADGVMWAWEFPIGPDSRLLRDGAPNWCQYEIHNSAYPAHAARETARHMGDERWTRQVAWPIVYESARFYGSALRREADGRWHLQILPSMGQDESGPKDARNYLDALYSAEYCLRAAMEMGAELDLEPPEFERWRAILADGLAYHRLLNPDSGICSTCESPEGRHPFGGQKHPVQLNPLNYLPLGRLDEPVCRAYQRRYDLCRDAHKQIYYGWTPVAYLLASSRIGSAEGLLRDLATFAPSRIVDPDWIQIYESSLRHWRTYCVTSHAWYLLALADAMVTDFWGQARIGSACPEAWDPVRLSGLRTNDRRVWTGEKVGGRWNLSSHAV